jgi:hypothetical protein
MATWPALSPRNGSSVGSPSDVPVIPGGKGVADALDDYLGADPAASSTTFDQRAKTFLSLYRGAFDAPGNLTNGPALIASFADEIESFAGKYLTQRKADSSSKISDQELLNAADNIRPCSKELAKTFVNILVAPSKTPGGKMIATGRTPAPLPKSAGACPFSTAGVALRIETAAGVPVAALWILSRTATAAPIPDAPS